ncbi:hypothetical protein FJZ19_02320 [Candidatus Pacearchaeota archaeon]|nr:hypothetical protein [Candidatus Pacearchaeota archaeon]
MTNQKDLEKASEKGVKDSSTFKRSEDKSDIFGIGHALSELVQLSYQPLTDKESKTVYDAGFNKGRGKNNIKK